MTGEVWYLGAPMEVDEAILREVGLKSGAHVTSAGWKQIVAAKARRASRERRAPRRPLRRKVSASAWLVLAVYAAVIVAGTLHFAGVLQ